MKKAVIVAVLSLTVAFAAAAQESPVGVWEITSVGTAEALLVEFTADGRVIADFDDGPQQKIRWDEQTRTFTLPEIGAVRYEIDGDRMLVFFHGVDEDHPLVAMFASSFGTQRNNELEEQFVGAFMETIVQFMSTTPFMMGRRISP